MSIAGVSGNEEDQDIINLLRDVTLFLLNSSTRPINYEVGHMLFSTLLLAMRRGYIETERFPEATANVIAYYAIKPSSLPSNTQVDPSIRESSSWIAEIFEDRKALYEQYADITVTCANEMLRYSVEDVYAKINAYFAENYVTKE